MPASEPRQALREGCLSYVLSLMPIIGFVTVSSGRVAARIRMWLTVGVSGLIVAGAVIGCGDREDRAYEGRSAEYWANALSSAEPTARVRAADALYHIQPRSRHVVRALLLAMSDSSAAVQTAVAVALGAIGPSGVPALTGAVTDDHASVRALALGILGSQGSDAAAAAPAIIDALRDSSADVRAAAAFALERLGPRALGSTAVAETSLVRATRDSAAAVRAAAFGALATISSDTTLMRASFQRAVFDTSASVRQSALQLATKSGQPPAQAVATLARLARDPNAALRASAYRALGAYLGTTAGASARLLLLHAAIDPDPGVRESAARTLSPAPPSQIR